jgi:thioesterase domain-containing protein
MTILALRTGGADRALYCLTGWGDLPKLRRGLAGTPDAISIDAWMPAPLAEVADESLPHRLARHVLDHVAAGGRLTVVGYSHAGQLALAVARLLAAARSEVRLVLLDTFAPSHYLDLPLSNEFFRPAPFPHPTAGPLVSALNDLQSSLHDRAVTARDLAEAAELPHRYIDELLGFAVAFDARLARLDARQFTDLMAVWLCLLLLMRNVDSSVLAIDALYLQSREHRERIDPLFDESQIDAWRKVLPMMAVEAVGEEHADMLRDRRVVRATVPGVDPTSRPLPAPSPGRRPRC